MTSRAALGQEAGISTGIFQSDKLLVAITLIKN